jgi:hypothetical protein
MAYVNAGAPLPPNPLPPVFIQGFPNQYRGKGGTGAAASHGYPSFPQLDKPREGNSDRGAK